MRILEVPSFEKERRHGQGKLDTVRDGWRILHTMFYELMH